VPAWAWPICFKRFIFVLNVGKTHIQLLLKAQPKKYAHTTPSKDGDSSFLILFSKAIFDFQTSETNFVEKA
jgi:hypothetical protein